MMVVVLTIEADLPHVLTVPLLIFISNVIM